MKNEDNVMANLQERAIAAHGGLPRWEQLSAVRAHLIQGGVLWAVKGQAHAVDDVFVKVDLHRQFTSHYPIGGPGRHSVFRGDYVAIEDENGGIVEERKDPRVSFADHTFETPWDTLQLAYFVGYAMWTYLTVPFSFAMPGFRAEELAPWKEKGETWRRLKATYPPTTTARSRGAASTAAAWSPDLAATPGGARKALPSTSDLVSRRIVMSGNIGLDVFISPYKPVVSTVPGWDSGKQATWPASTASLLSGERDAVLVDALITVTEAEQLAAWVRASGKRLTAVYITHGHGDHFFGLNTILAAFPDAKALALPQVVLPAQEQVGEGNMSFWEATFPGQIPRKPIVPEPIDGTMIDLEGHELRLIDVGQSDTHPSSVVHVPDLQAVVGGDVAYNGIHMWLALTGHTEREGWLAALDTVESLAPKILVAGHQDPAASSTDVAGMLAASRQYIRDFDEAAAAAGSAEELIAAMMSRHGDRGNPYTLWTAAAAMFAQQP